MTAHLRWVHRTAGSMATVLAVAAMAVGSSSQAAHASGWKDCGGGFNMTFMRVESKGLLCSSAWVLGEEALDAWDGFTSTVTVRGFRCKMWSGYPYNAAAGGTCRKGSKASKFVTGD